MDYYLTQATRCMDRMTTTQWMAVFFVVVLIGLFCMRGFGSRSSY